MAETVTGDQVWKALENDPTFRNDIPPGKPVEIFRELALGLPAVLADQLGTPLTMESFVKAKLAVMRYIAEGGFTKRLIAAYPEEAFGGIFSPEEMAEQGQAAIEALLPRLEELAGNMPAWLAENGVDEPEALAHPKIGKLNAAAMEEYRAGTLTVGRLLALQPATIVKNTD